jgi:hypothetical protein
MSMSPPPAAPPALSPERRAALVALTAKIRSKESLPLGILAGVAGAILGALGWAAISAATGYQIGYAAIGIAFLVGYGVRTFGSGFTRTYGIVGAVLSLFGCALGNVGAALAQIAKHENVPYLELLRRVDYAKLPSILVDTFQPMDLLFYGIAAYFGYKYALRRLTKEEIATLPA